MTVLWPGQKIGVHDHKPYDSCQRDCPANPLYSDYVAEYLKQEAEFVNAWCISDEEYENP